MAVASAVVGWVLFGDTNPALWTPGYWPVRELLPAAVAFSVGGAVLLDYPMARYGTPLPRSDGSRTTCNPRRWRIADSRQR